MILQVVLRVFATLPNALAVIRVPGAGFLDDTGLHAEIDQFAAFRDALAVHDVEIDGLERRRHFVLDDLDAGLVADDLVALLDRADAADIEPDRGVEFERVAAGRRLRAAEHDADLHPDLVDEDDHRPRPRDRAGQLAQGLAHQPRMQPHMAVAHLAFEFGARHQRRDRIDDEYVDRPGAHQRVGDFERLLAGIRLRNQQIVDIDPKLFGIERVERVLGVDKGAGAAAFLRLGDDVQRQRRLARAFRAVYLDDAASRQAADAERDIEPERAGRDHVDVRRGLARAELHDRALAESALDLAERRVQSPLSVHHVLVQKAQRGLHGFAPYLISYRACPCNARRTGSCTRFVRTSSAGCTPSLSCYRGPRRAGKAQSKIELFRRAG